MTSPRGFGVGPSFLRGALPVLTGLLLLGCEARRPSLNTAPQGESDVEVSKDLMPADTMISGETPSAEVAASASLGGPLAGLDAVELARFTAGREEFQEEETVEDGLGPVFNEVSCVKCHDSPVGGTTGRTEIRFGRGTLAGFDPLTRLGGSLLQDHAIGSIGIGDRKFIFVPEVVPRVANVTAKRITTPLFGLGLVDAVTDAALLQLARLQARYAPAIRGTPNMVVEVPTGAIRVGRFGWKAQVPTLHQFSGDAYLNEMGFTSPDFPDENPPQGNREALAFNPVPALNDSGENIEEFADFMTLLGPPPRGPKSFLTEAGGLVFLQIGCASCHTPTLITGDSPVQALSHKAFHPYSDFLLHEMGMLGDGIVQGQSTGRQMRTAPLWGLRARPALLHDGRASTPEAAILQHGGQGSYSRNRFLRLSPFARIALLVFLRSL